MDNRAALEKLSQSFTRETLIHFLRAAHGGFRPERADYSHYLEAGSSIGDLYKLGRLDFADGRRMILLAGQASHALTSQGGKLKQYEIARKVLKDEYWDAGIFVFHDSAGHFRFSWITAQYTGTKREFSSFRRYTYFVSPEASARTFVDQIGKADFSSVERITEAFSVEPVTKAFFTKFREIFEAAEKTIDRQWSEEKKRLYTQRFFNRVLFITFLERKGWLTFTPERPEGPKTFGTVRKDYLRALFEDYYKNPRDRNANFHRSRLNTLFFMGLNHPSGDKRLDAAYKPILSLIGDVPYLNGGLFEEEEDDKDGPTFPDAIIAKVLNELVYQFNFTVTESTPLDVEVAVDPEMLGRIFEELVTGRHESGSYYTPKPVVQFMCREALKGYLETALPSESAEGLALFVDKNDASMLRNPMQVVDALRAVKVCDPACGSGAYLLGMLHELLEQYAAIFSQHQKDAPTIYKTKLDIIQNNLYGVDKDNFAVNIARLRLWLSLIVDFEGETPPPLPNLDFKIECGDSLTAPDPSGGLQPDMFRQQQVKEFLALKNEFMSVHAGSDEKKKLAKQIEDLKEKIKEWAHPANKPLKVSETFRGSQDSFDWQVDFAEVFAPELATPSRPSDTLPQIPRSSAEFGAGQGGGFDIVLANPPYVRQEEIINKPMLKKVFGEDTSYDVYNGRADLFVYFYARAIQILKHNGVIAFISSDKFISRGYAEKLRKLLISKIQIESITDFGEYPIFGATIETCIFIGQRTEKINKQEEFTFCRIESEKDITDISESIKAKGWKIAQSRLTDKEWVMAEASGFATLDALNHNTIPLGEYVENKIFSGVKTGRNNVFIIDEQTKKELLKEGASNNQIIKKWLVGNDIDNWGITWSNQYLIFAKHGMDIADYPSIYKYLKQHKQTLSERATIGQHEWYELQQPQMGIYEYFEKPKIVYQNVSRYYKFAYDTEGYYPDMNVFIIPTNDLFLLGVLGSSGVTPIKRGVAET